MEDITLYWLQIYIKNKGINGKAKNNPQANS